MKKIYTYSSENGKSKGYLQIIWTNTLGENNLMILDPQPNVHNYIQEDVPGVPAGREETNEFLLFQMVPPLSRSQDLRGLIHRIELLS